MSNFDIEASESDVVKVQKSEIVQLLRRLQGFQNTHLILEEKEAELKNLRQKCQFFQVQFGEMKQQMRSRPKNTDRHVLTKSRSAEPEIFVFPVTSNKLCSSLDSNSVELDGREDEHFTQSDSSGVMSGFGGSTNASVDWSSEISGVPGVSEQYFVSIMNEMVKTKKYLSNLLKVQKETEEKTEAMVQKFQSEIESLKKAKTELEATLKVQTTESSVHQESQRKVQSQEEEADDNSLEVESLDKLSCFTELGTQTESTPDDAAHVQLLEKSLKNTVDVDTTLTLEIERLRTENKVLSEKVKEQDKEEHGKTEIEQLKEEISVLQQKLTDRNSSYSDLEQGVRVLSQCMQEEKKKSRQLEQKLTTEQQSSTSMKMKLSEKLAYLRNENETLRQEVRAMEKLQDPLPQVIPNHHSSVGNTSISRSSPSAEGAGGVCASGQSKVSSARASPLPVVSNLTKTSTPRQHMYAAHQSENYQQSNYSSGSSRPVPSHPVSTHNQTFTTPNQAFTTSNQPSTAARQSFVAPNQPFILPNQAFTTPNQPCTAPNHPFTGDAASGYDFAGYTNQAVEESQPHDSLKCPRCETLFEADIPYIQHLTRCME